MVPMRVRAVKGARKAFTQANAWAISNNLPQFWQGGNRFHPDYSVIEIKPHKVPLGLQFKLAHRAGSLSEVVSPQAFVAHL